MRLSAVRYDNTMECSDTIFELVRSMISEQRMFKYATKLMLKRRGELVIDQDDVLVVGDNFLFTIRPINNGILPSDIILLDQKDLRVMHGTRISENEIIFGNALSKCDGGTPNMVYATLNYEYSSKNLIDDEETNRVRIIASAFV